MARKFYKVVDYVRHCDVSHLGLSIDEWRAVKPYVRAVRTSQYRSPKAGEWYLSGAIPEAYRANKDLKDSYYICRLVLVEPVEREVQLVHSFAARKNVPIV